MKTNIASRMITAVCEGKDSNDIINEAVGKATRVNEDIKYKGGDEIVDPNLTPEEIELCSQWHSGQWDPLYALSSSGTIQAKDIGMAISNLNKIKKDIPGLVSGSGHETFDNETVEDLIYKLEALQPEEEEDEEDTEFRRIAQMGTVKFITNGGQEMTGKISDVVKQMGGTRYLIKTEDGKTWNVEKDQILGKV